MSYCKDTSVVLHGSDCSMTPEEFEHTVSAWEVSIPALAAYIRGPQAVVEAARAHMRHCTNGSVAIDKALAALDETPDARVVRCARAVDAAHSARDLLGAPEPEMRELREAVRALTEPS